jgi:hypothetical protein
MTALPSPDEIDPPSSGVCLSVGAPSKHTDKAEHRLANERHEEGGSPGRLCPAQGNISSSKGAWAMVKLLDMAQLEFLLV